MRRLQILGVLGLAACGSDSGIKVFNSPPEASIISHDDGDEVKEATEVLFRGMGSTRITARPTLRPAGRWTVR